MIYQIVNECKLCVSFSGYYKQEDETAQTIDKNGWLHTGDIGFIDDEENVFIIDRIKELIKYKGFQVSSWCFTCLEQEKQMNICMQGGYKNSQPIRNYIKYIILI